MGSAQNSPGRSKRKEGRGRGKKQEHSKWIRGYGIAESWCADGKKQICPKWVDCQIASSRARKKAGSGGRREKHRKKHRKGARCEEKEIR